MIHRTIGMYAEDAKTGKLRFVDNVPNGNACGCVCPGCKVPLQARNSVDMQRQHHFAHQPGYEPCEYGYETALIKLAQEIMSQPGFKLMLPAVVCDAYSGVPGHDEKCFLKVLSSAKQVAVDKVTLEHRIHQQDGSNFIVPDIVVTAIDKQGRNHELIVEIVVSDGADKDKRKRIKKLGLSAIEIDLSFRYDFVDKATLVQLLTEDSHYKEWIYNRFAAHYEREEKKKRKDRLAEYKRNERLRMERIAQARKEARSMGGQPLNPIAPDRECAAERLEPCPLSTLLTQGDYGQRYALASTCKTCEYFMPVTPDECYCRARHDVGEKVQLMVCPKCGAPLVLNKGGNGRLYSCTDAEHCDFTYSDEFHVERKLSPWLQGWERSATEEVQAIAQREGGVDFLLLTHELTDAVLIFLPADCWDWDETNAAFLHEQLLGLQKHTAVVVLDYADVYRSRKFSARYVGSEGIVRYVSKKIGIIEPAFEKSPFQEIFDRFDESNISLYLELDRELTPPGGDGAFTQWYRKPNDANQAYLAGVLSFGNDWIDIDVRDVRTKESILNLLIEEPFGAVSQPDVSTV